MVSRERREETNRAGSLTEKDTRISFEEMRKLLPKDEIDTDEFLAELRDELYGFAQLAFDVYITKKRKGIK